MDAVERYFCVVKAEWPERNVGNLRFYLDYIFDGVPLAGRRVLDIGAGDGVYSFYAAATGAARVVALEPEAEGSSPGVTAKFSHLSEVLRLDSVELPTRELPGLRSRRQALRCAVPARRDQPSRRVRDDGDRPRRGRSSDLSLTVLKTGLHGSSRCEARRLGRVTEQTVLAAAHQEPAPAQH